MTETLRFRITFAGPFHVARGEAADGADRTVDRDVPLPASSLKGVMRAAAGQRLGLPGWLVNQVFGSSDAASPWAWSDAYVDSALTASTARIRMTAEGVVADGALLIGEHVWTNQGHFLVSQNGYLSPEGLRDHRIVLRAAARDITALGGARRRGEGWVDMKDDVAWTVEDSAALIELRNRTEVRTGPPSADRAPATFDDSGRAEQWRVFRYRIVTEQRVSAGVRSEIGNDRAAHQVIPGSAIRGALATAWMRSQGLTRPDQRMANIFERSAIIRQAVPIGSTLIPISGRSCKYQDPETHGAHQAHDEALIRQGQPKAGVPRRPAKFCPGGSASGKGWVTVDQQVRATRTALAANGTALDGQLFSVRATRPCTVLIGEILLSADDPEFVTWLTGLRSIRIGAQRSISGAATWEAQGVEDLTVDDAEPPETGSPQVLRCRSPLIAVDEYGASTSDISMALERAFPGKTITVNQSWVRTVAVGGWHMASDLPKPEEWAIAPGSTFLVSGLPHGAHETLRPGLGLRRLEGFGEIEIVKANDDPWNSPVEDPGPFATMAPTQQSSVAREIRVFEPSEDEPRRLSAITPESDSAPSQPEERGPSIADLFAAVPPERRAEVLAGLQKVSTEIASFFSSGRAEVARGVAKSAIGRPWARGLPAAVTDLISQLLASDQIDAVRDRLRTYVPGEEA